MRKPTGSTWYEVAQFCLDGESSDQHAPILSDILSTVLGHVDWLEMAENEQLYEFLALCWPHAPLQEMLHQKMATERWSRERRQNFITAITTHLPSIPPPQADPDQIIEIAATDLMQREFTPIRWYATGLLHEGMILFGGKSKRGKSLIAQNLAVSLATGGTALGYYEIPEAVRVLYCALEDGPRRTQRRLRSIAADADLSRLKYTFKMPPLDQGGIEYLVQHIYEEYAVLIVDVLAHVETAGRNGLRDYHEVYQTFAPIQALRSEHQFALIMITHLRKSESEEVFDDLHGSVAYQGAQDALWVLQRRQGENRANLHIRDKDAEDKIVELQYHDGGIWNFVGEGDEHQTSTLERKIFRYLLDESRPQGIKDIMQALDIPQGQYGAMRARLMRLAANESIVRTDRGRYTVARRADYDDDLPF